MLPIDAVGKVFRSRSGELFGAIRPVTGATPSDFGLAHGDVFAEDECGNYFLRQLNQVLFWDHEDGQLKVLADTFELFLAGLELRAPAVLKPGQVKRAWIDPAFAKGIKDGPKDD
jgi:hypothetical protein